MGGECLPTFCISSVLLRSSVGTSVPSGADTMPATGCPWTLVCICVALAGRLSTLSMALVRFLLPRWAPLCRAQSVYGHASTSSSAFDTGDRFAPITPFYWCSGPNISMTY